MPRWRRRRLKRLRRKGSKRQVSWITYKWQGSDGKSHSFGYKWTVDAESGTIPTDALADYALTMTLQLNIEQCELCGYTVFPGRDKPHTKQECDEAVSKQVIDS
jgi:hypothetical protein